MACPDNEWAYSITITLPSKGRIFFYRPSWAVEWEAMKKSQIHLHRSHRKISFSWAKVLYECLLSVPACWILILISFPFLSRVASQYLLRLNVPLDSNSLSNLIESPFLFGHIHTPELLGRYPVPLLSYTLFIISVLTIVITHKTRIPKPISVWISFVCLVNIVSALFFIFLPDLFPYSVQAFCEIFIKTEVAIWIFIPLIMSFSLLPLPSSAISKFITVVFTLLYATAFGLVRYILFVSILAHWSYLFMAVLFFCFGPFIDFISVVGVYSFYVSLISRKINRDLRVWNWS